MSDPRAQTEIGPTHGEGLYRCYPLSWALEAAKNKPDKTTGKPSQSQPIAIQWAVVQKWTPETKQWSQEWPEGYFLYSRTYIVGKEGQLSAPGIEQLVKAGLWDGQDFGAFGGPPPSIYVVVDVRESKANDGTGRSFGYRGEWLQADTDTPVERTGGFQPTSPDLISAARARFGSGARAIAGGVRGNVPAAAAPPMQPGVAPAAPSAAVAPPAAAAPVAAPAVGRPVPPPAARPAQQAPPARPLPPPPTGARAGAPAMQPAVQAAPAGPPAGFGDPAGGSFPWEREETPS